MSRRLYRGLRRPSRFAMWQHNCPAFKHILRGQAGRIRLVILDEASYCGLCGQWGRCGQCCVSTHT